MNDDQKNVESLNQAMRIAGPTVLEELMRARKEHGVEDSAVLLIVGEDGGVSVNGGSKSRIEEVVDEVCRDTDGKPFGGKIPPQREGPDGLWCLAITDLGISIRWFNIGKFVPTSPGSDSLN